MTLIEHTAYPRLKRTLTPKELDQIYTPTLAEIFLAHRTAKGPVAMLGFLVPLKVFQRLGYAVATSEVPRSIVDYRPSSTNGTRYNDKKNLFFCFSCLFGSTGG